MYCSISTHNNMIIMYDCKIPTDPTVILLHRGVAKLTTQDAVLSLFYNSTYY